MNVGVIGAGKISGIYLQNMTKRFANLTVTGIAANHLENAKKKAAEYGIRACTVPELLNDDKVELVVNLTPVSAHYPLIKQALQNGKHVYTEKCLTETLQQAQELLQLAQKNQLYFGSAPETFLTGPCAKAKELLASDSIGEVTGFNVNINLNINMLYPQYRFLKEKGSGIGLDRGVYFLTQLVHLLGKAKAVSGFSFIKEPVRKLPSLTKPSVLEDFIIQGENQLCGTLVMENGAIGTVNFNGNTVFPEFSSMTLYGTKGILKLPDANCFYGDVELLQSEGWGEKAVWQTVKNDVAAGDNLRGIGPSLMVQAIKDGNENPVDAALDYHVMQIVDGLLKSSEEGKSVYL